MLTKEELAEYEETGYVSPVKGAEGAKLEYFQSEFAKLERELGEDKCQLSLLNKHEDTDFVMEIAKLPNLVEVARDTLKDPKIRIMASHFFCKYGPSDKYVGWHQDVTYWGLRPRDTVTAWFALDDSDEENGCMRVVSGTHKKGIIDHQNVDDGKNLLSHNQKIDLTEDEEKRIVPIVLKAGEASIHEGYLYHGSYANTSSRRRCGLTIRYIPSHVSASGKTYDV